MRTITDDVGNGPIRIFAPAAENVIGFYTEADSANIPRLTLEIRAAAPIESNPNITTSIDGRRERCELNLAGGPAPKGAILDTVDNGPELLATLPFTHIAIETKRYPLGEMFERGDLGNGEPENRPHWFDAQRFKRVHADARGEPSNDTAKDGWRELMFDFFEGFFDNLVGSFDADEGFGLSDDMEFEDSTTPAAGLVDFAG
jgi:hypothetical protein